LEEGGDDDGDDDDDDDDVDVDVELRYQWDNGGTTIDGRGREGEEEGVWERVRVRI
jgi:hypothetical protein